MVVYVYKKLRRVLKLKNQRFCCSLNPNILKFKNIENFKTLSEEDLFNLFKGFVSIIKKTVRAELEQDYMKKLNYYHLKIQKLISKIK